MHEMRRTKGEHVGAPSGVTSDGIITDDAPRFIVLVLRVIRASVRLDPDSYCDAFSWGDHLVMRT